MASKHQIWEDAWEYYKRSRKLVSQRFQFRTLRRRNLQPRAPDWDGSSKPWPTRRATPGQWDVCIHSRVSSLLKKASATSHLNYTSFLRSLPSGLCNTQVCSRLDCIAFLFRRREMSWGPVLSTSRVYHRLEGAWTTQGDDHLSHWQVGLFLVAAGKGSSASLL